MKKRFTLLVTLLMLLGFVIAGCQKSTPVIAIESPQAALSPMLVGVASIFMKINNSGGADDVLISAGTDIPGTITELHDIIDGKMVKVESIDVPAESQVVLRPAKHHIMVFKLPKEMRQGAVFNLYLKFKKAGEKTVPVELVTFSPGTRNFN